MQRKLKFIADPGHGWLSVPRKDLNTLGIAHKISQCSFQKGKRVYLEEDRDASFYLEAAKSQGWDLQINESFSDRRSWVRYQERYKI